VRAHAPLLEPLFAAPPPEDCYQIEEIRDQLPDFLRGTCYMNGPARFSRGEFRHHHWLDGDGMACAVRFDERGVWFTNRFVRTRKLIEEERAGRPLFRTFGTGFPGDRLLRGIMLESPANISVYPFSNTLLALGEQGLPWELDPVTLETRGPFTFRGALNDVTPFGAHPKVDVASGELINVGVAFSAVEPTLNVYSFSREGTLNWRRRHALDHPRSVHDFGISTRYIVLHLSPYLLDAAALRNGRTVMEALSWRPELGSYLLVISRESGDRIASIPVGSGYCLHHINCYEDADTLVVDVIEFERPIYEQYRNVSELFPDIGEGRPVRFMIEPGGAKLLGRLEIEYGLAPDFPSVDPQRATQSYREFWSLGISATGRRGEKFFDQLVHADWTQPKRPRIYQTPPGRFFAGEPAFVSDPNRADAGVLICPMCDVENHRSEIGIFDAHEITRGPVAVLRLKRCLPPLFHSSFCPEESSTALRLSKYLST
jgi:all-trans-8'-apo-beta-carotenal 15,15'-oxygenase